MQFTHSDCAIIMDALSTAVEHVLDIDDVRNYTDDDLDGITARATEFIELHNRIAEKIGGGVSLLAPLDADWYGEREDQPCDEFK